MGVYRFLQCGSYVLITVLAGSCATDLGRELPPQPPAAAAATATATAQRDDTAAPDGDAYYLSTCANCDRMLGSVGVAVDIVHDGRSLRLCTPTCDEQFRADPARTIAHIDSVMIKDQMPHYPLSTSIVSGEPLPAAPTDFIWCNRLIRVAGAREREAFLREPRPFIRTLDREVIRSQEPMYGMPTRCPVQGDILDSDVPIDFVVANRMVRVCCQRCVRVVRARPYQYIAMVDYANREAAEQARREDR